jgi:hypothetical protein
MTASSSAPLARQPPDSCEAAAGHQPGVAPRAPARNTVNAASATDQLWMMLA